MTDMVMPDIAQPAPPKKSNKTIIIVVVVVVVLCCLCIALIATLWFTGVLGNLIPSLGGTDITGDWNVHFSWDCTGNYSLGDLVFYSDGTFNVNDDSTLWGAWTLTGKNVDFTFDEWPNSHYIGTLDSTGDYMDGTMTNLDDMSGCWYADR